MADAMFFDHASHVKTKRVNVSMDKDSLKKKWVKGYE